MNEKRLDDLIGKLKAAAGDNLRTVALYGSAASGEYHEKYSDLNVLCLFERLDGSAMEKIAAASAWWVRKGHPAPLVFSLEELRNSADLFPIELLDIRANRRVLYGEDAFASLEVPMKLHRVVLERELRTNLLRLRQAYLSGKPNSKRTMRLMTASISSFVTLFRHTLIALGEKAPISAREGIDRLASALNFDASAFHAVWDVREKKRKASDLKTDALFRAYVDCVQRIADEMDRRLAAP